MRKLVLITMILGIMFFFVTGCSNDNVGSKSKYDVSDDLVSMEIDEDSLTKTKAKFIMTNHTDDEYSYGNPYFMEIEVDGDWYELKTVNDLFFTMPAFELKANESVEFEIDWEYGYGKLKPGKYRMVKAVFHSTDTSDSGGKDLYVAAEFTIK